MFSLLQVGTTATPVFGWGNSGVPREDLCLPQVTPPVSDRVGIELLNPPYHRALLSRGHLCEPPGMKPARVCRVICLLALLLQPVGLWQLGDPEPHKALLAEARHSLLPQQELQSPKQMSLDAGRVCGAHLTSRQLTHTHSSLTAFLTCVSLPIPGGTAACPLQSRAGEYPLHSVHVSSYRLATIGTFVDVCFFDSWHIFFSKLLIKYFNLIHKETGNWLENQFPFSVVSN